MDQRFWGRAVPTPFLGEPWWAYALVVLLLAVPLAAFSQCCPPVITSQPQSQTALLGTNVTFNVGISSSTGPSYQWRYNGVNISGATSSSFVINNVQPSQTGSYSVAVTNAVGSVISADAALAVSGILNGWGDNDNGQASVPTNSLGATAISGGAYHSLALLGNSTLQAWGNNDFGQGAIPPGLSNVLAIDCGASYNLVVKSDGTVTAWGDGSYGQTNVPPGLSNVVAVSGGSSHCLALKTDGTVIGWGDNTYSNTTIPTGLGKVLSIAAGGLHSMALKNDSTVVAWGYNGSGQTNVPAGLSNVVAIAAGGDQSLALQRDGTVVAWGGNTSGETNVPFGLSNCVAVAAGAYFSSALRNDGTVVVWGDNSFGQANVPAGLGMVSGIACGGYHTLALGIIGNAAPVFTVQPVSQQVKLGTNVTFTALAAGAGPLNYQWQLNGTNIAGATNSSYYLASAQVSASGNYQLIVSNPYGAAISSSASLVILPSFVSTPQSQIVTQGFPIITFTCVASGTPPLSYRWTSNGFTIGQTNSSYSVSNVQARDAVPYRVIVTNLAGSVTSPQAVLTVLLNPGMAAAWGNNTFGQSVVASNLSGVKAVAAGVSHSLALKSNGNVMAWGLNTSGQTNVPSGLSNVISIASHGNHNLALKGDGTVVAWGANSNGQANVPAGLNNIVAVSAGSNHSVALRNDGKVFAWGDNSFGQTNVPMDLTNAVAIAAGYYHTLAIKSDGSLVAWGRNNAGESSIPAGLSGVVSIAGGLDYSMALRTNGTVLAWGTGNNGITNGAAGISNAIAIACGGHLSLALQSNGKVIAWGQNTFGQTNVPAGATNVISLAAGDQHGLVAIGDGSPVITVQPLSQVVSPGANPTFTVMAAGYAPLSYQWRFNGISIMGATNNVYLRPNVLGGDSGSYSVVVANALGAATSSNATLFVACPASLAAFVQVVLYTNVCQPFSPDLTTQKAITVAPNGPCPAFCYRVVVTNSGCVTITNVVMADSTSGLNLSACYQSPLTLAPGGSPGSSYSCILAAITRCTNATTVINVAGTALNFGPLVAADTNAVIINSSITLQAIKAVPNGMEFRITGPGGYVYTIQASTNLANWISLVTTSVAGGVLDYTDTTATNLANRFYRVVSP